MESAIIERRSGSTALGVVLIVLGVIAVMSPLFTAVVLIRVIAWLLIFAAIDQVVHAFRSRDQGGLWLKLILAVLYAVAGVMVLSRPVQGAIAATAVIGCLLIADGVMEIALGAQLRGTYASSSTWLFAGGVLSILLGALILYRLPWSMAAVGLLVGIRLIFKGIEQIAGPSVSKTTKTIEDRAQDRAA